MAWYWSDDIARAAIEAGLGPERTLQEWIRRPVGFAAEDGLALVDVASQQLGLDLEVSAGAA